jgi:hypothetical protein
MFFWLLCTQFYTPIFGLFYTQYSLLITIIHCCWYITIMLYIYIHIHPNSISLCTYTYIYIYITIVAGISQYTIYMEVSYVMGGPKICLRGRFHQHRRAGVVPRHGDLGKAMVSLGK